MPSSTSKEEDEAVAGHQAAHQPAQAVADVAPHGVAAGILAGIHQQADVLRSEPKPRALQHLFQGLGAVAGAAQQALPAAAAVHGRRAGLLLGLPFKGRLPAGVSMHTAAQL